MRPQKYPHQRGEGTRDFEKKVGKSGLGGGDRLKKGHSSGERETFIETCVAGPTKNPP